MGVVPWDFPQPNSEGTGLMGNATTLYIYGVGEISHEATVIFLVKVLETMLSYGIGVAP